MYGKIFEQMYDGTLAGNWKALITFQQMIVLATKDGVLDMTPQALAGRTGIPLEIIQDGLEVLAAPDPYSRTPDQEGRRIILMDEHRPWGWVIVNHKKYRDLIKAEQKRAADRERLKAKRGDMSQSVAGCRKGSQGVAGCSDVPGSDDATNAADDLPTELPPGQGEGEKLAESPAEKNSNEINDVADCRTVSQEVANVAHTDTNTDIYKKNACARGNGVFVIDGEEIKIPSPHPDHDKEIMALCKRFTVPTYKINRIELHRRLTMKVTERASGIGVPG